MGRGPSLLPAIRTAFRFLGKQPVLLDVLLWLLLVPATIVDAVIGSLARGGWQTNLLVAGSGIHNATPAVILLLLALAIFTLWGQASVLVIGRRLLKRTAGRSRTSLRAVTREARGYIIPLLLTQILWAASILLWGLLIILPGIAAAIRGVLFPVLIVAEQRNAYRDALRSSAAVIRGHLWRMTASVLAAACLFIALPAAIDEGISAATIAAPEIISIAGIVLSRAVDSLGMVLFWLTLCALYAQMKTTSDGQPRRVRRR